MRTLVGVGATELLVVVTVGSVAGVWALETARSLLHRRTAAALSVAALVVCLAAIGWLTLRPLVPVAEAPRILELHPVRAAAHGFGDGMAWIPVLRNIALFVPLGATSGWLLRHRPVWVPVTLAGSLSVGIETLQFAFPIGRVASSADVIANTVGGALGVGAARLAGWLPVPVGDRWRFAANGPDGSSVGWVRQAKSDVDA